MRGFFGQQGQPCRCGHRVTCLRGASVFGQLIAVGGKPRAAQIAGFAMQRPGAGQHAREELQRGRDIVAVRLRQALRQILQRGLAQCLGMQRERLQRGIGFFGVGRGLLAQCFQRAAHALQRVGGIRRQQRVVLARVQRTGRRVRGRNRKGLHAGNDIRAQRVVTHRRGGRVAVGHASQQIQRVGQQALRQVDVVVRVLTQQQVDARSQALGSHVGRHQPGPQRAERQRQHEPQIALQIIASAARFAFKCANAVQQFFQRRVSGGSGSRIGLGAVCVGCRRTQRSQQCEFEFAAQTRQPRQIARGQQQRRQVAQLVGPQVRRVDAFFAQAGEHGLIRLEQAQRLFSHAGHQVGHVFLQRLHGAREHVQRVCIGLHGAGIDGFEQALGGLAIHVDAAQADDQQRAGGLVQVLTGQAQRGGITRADDFRVGNDIGRIFAELAHGIVQRGAHVGRNPSQRGEIARRRNRLRTECLTPG